MRRHAKATSRRSAHAAEPTRATSRRARGLFGLVCLCVLGLAVFLGSGAPAAGADEACPNEAQRAEQHATYLPDCRAYEMVSPPVKRGADVMPDSERTRAAADGNSAVFASLGGFADAQGSGVAFEYMSERSGSPAPGDNGWSTHGITAAEPALTLSANALGLEPHYDGDLSSDLSSGVFRAWKPLTEEDQNVADVTNLYVRHDLHSAGSGTYKLVTACPGCSAPVPANYLYVLADRPYLAGATPDFSRVAFESPINLTADAPPQTELTCVGFPPFLPPLGVNCKTRAYVSHEGAVSLVGRIPPPAEAECDDSGAPGATPCGGAAESFIGAGGATVAAYTSHAISADGSRVVFSNAHTNSGAPGIYERIDGERTVKLNVPDPGAPADTAKPAFYWDASTDGSRVFFTTKQALAEDTAVNGISKLYMYSAVPDAGGRHLTALSVNGGLEAGVSGMIGADPGGGKVYFVGSSQIVPGEPPVSGVGIFLWDEGTVSYVGPIATGDVNSTLDSKLILADPKTARVTPDGSLLFVDHSAVGPTGFEQGACPGNGFQNVCGDVYVYTPATHHLQCASCNPAGAHGERDAADYVRRLTSGSVPTQALNHPLAADGGRVFFSTEEALVPRDTNGKYDAYEFDVESGEARLLSSGTSNEDSFFVDASASGDDVFIATRERLVGWDSDNNLDLYDARVDGGFPEPPPVPAACEGESCKGASPAAPGAGGAASAALHGAGNPAPGCRARARRALRLAHRAKRLRRRARRAIRHGKTRTARRFARQAKARAKRAHKLSRTAKRCRRANRGAGK